MAEKSISTMVMVPTYNEASNIELLIKEILTLSEDIGVVVVDDNSPDGTWRIVEELAKEDTRVHSGACPGGRKRRC